MGRASISIAITSNFNSRGIDAAIKKAEQLATSAVHYQGRFGKAAVDMGASMGQAAARLVSMGKSVADLGDRMTAGVTVPMGLAAAAAVASAAKIDTAWYNVRKTVDMTEEGYQRLKQGAMELAEVQPVSAETILNIESLGGQLGITNGYLEDFAKIVSGLDIATNLDSETAATELAQFRNIVQMSESDLDNFASTLVDLGNNTATTEADMMNLAMRFASAGHIAGMSNADILGLSAALSGLGMNAEAGGSAISRTVNDINNAVSTGGEKLQKWADLVGKTPEQFAEAWRKAPTEEFIDVLQSIGSAGEDMGTVLEELGITQLRQSDAMRRLASAGEYVTEVVQRANQAWRENSALQREVDNRNESLQARWDTFCNRMVNDLARIGQPLAEVGLDVLEGLEPAIQGVGDLAQAFADADPAVQRFAFNLAAVAMAAGPTLSVAGRLMQAVGNMGIRVGRVTQQWGVYQEALKTTDVSMLNTLANNQSMAASFGASRNAIVKAAGGLDRYNLAYAKTTDSIRRNIEQQTRQTAYQEAYNEALAKGNRTEEQCVLVAEKAAHSRETDAVVAKRQKEAINDLNSSIDASNVKTKLNTEAISDQEVAAAKASRTFGKMGDALKGALIGFGVSAAIGAVVAGITWLVSSMQEAAERANLLDKATNGLRESLTATGAAAEESGNSHRNLMSSIADTHEKVYKAIEDQSKLADAFAEVDKQAAVQMGTIDRSAEIIERYANKGSISAAQLSLLKSAIDDVNQACGTQYSVLENGAVVYETESGAIQENTDKILENIEARKRQIQLDATESKYQAAYENLVEQTYARAEAIDKLAKAQRRAQELFEKGEDKTPEETSEYIRLTNEFDGEIKKLEQDVDEINRTWGEAANTERYWADLMDSLSAKVQELSLDMQGLVDPASEFSAAFTAAGRDVVEFAAACEQAGINFDFLNSLTETEIQHMAETFDGSIASIVQGLEDLGKNEALENIGANWRKSIDDASGQIADAIANTHDVALAELAALAADMGIQGEEAMSRFLEGIRGGLDAGLELGDAAKLAERIMREFEDGLNADQARQLAQEFMNNLARGMGEKGALEQAIQSLKSALSQVDFTAEGQQAKTTWLAGFNSGTAEGNPLQPFQSNLELGLDTIHNTVNERGEATGEDVPLKFAEGVDANAGAVDGTGDSLVQRILDQLRSGVGQASGIGADTGQGYGDSVSGQGSVAEFAAMQTLGRLLQIWLLGIESARQAGTRTGTAYGEGTQTGFAGAAMAAAATVYNLIALLVVGVSAAATAGTQTGDAYARNLSTNLMKAATFADATVRAITTSLESGVEPARGAGTRTGDAFTNGMKDAAGKAPGIANGISTSTGYAFGSGTSAASSAGSALGSAFASAVWSSGSQAISYARSIRNSVKDIFSNIPTANIRVNVQRTYSTARAALPMQTPVMPVPATFGLTRAETVAERAVNRVAAARTVRESTSEAMGAAVSATASQSGPSIDYDAMYRVVKQGVKAAIDESGALSPVVELDGRLVSKQLAPSMDYELGQRDRRRGGRR